MTGNAGLHYDEALGEAGPALPEIAEGGGGASAASLGAGVRKVRRLPEGRRLITIPNPATDRLEALFELKSASRAALFVAGVSGDILVRRDLGRLKELLHRVVVDDVDHADLNEDVSWLRDVNPTAENLAVRIWDRLEDRLDGARLVSVRLHETERNVVEYRGE